MGDHAVGMRRATSLVIEIVIVGPWIIMASEVFNRVFGEIILVNRDNGDALSSSSLSMNAPDSQNGFTFYLSRDR